MNKKTTKGILIISITLIVITIIGYILLKLFYPKYINYRFQKVFSNYKQIVLLYNNQNLDNYIKIRRDINNGVNKKFIKEEVKSFYNDYPFIIGGDKLLKILNKIIGENNISKTKLRNIINKIGKNYNKIYKKTDKTIFLQGTLQIKKLKKEEFCIIRDLDKNKILKENNTEENKVLLQNLATLSTYNNIFGKIYGKKDICLKYVNKNLIMLYIKYE